MPKFTKYEPIDDYLASQGLTRKITAKDGSCLFRAVAEQVFHTQALHHEVRQSCIRFMERNREHFEPFVEGPFDQHLFRLKDAKEWAGQVEISALSLMYKRDFIIYQEVGKPPSNVTQNGYTDTVILCFSHGNHYDSVFTRTFLDNLAICQAIVYEILYKDVFKVAKEVDEAVEILRNSTTKKTGRSYGQHSGFRDGSRGNETDNKRGHEQGSKFHEDDERDRFGRLRSEKRRPPLPYKVAKALDPEMYRNVEFDCWNESNREQQHQDFLMATGLQFAPGDKVQVFLDDPKKWYNAHIQEVKPDKGPITVFIEDLGEKHAVPLKNVKPHPLNPQRPWSVVGGRNYKNFSGYHQKYSNGVVNGVDYRNRNKPGKWGRGQGMVLVGQSYPQGTGNVPDQQNVPYNVRNLQGNFQQAGHKGPKAPSPFRANSPPPRFMNRLTDGHPDHQGRGRPQGYPPGQMMQGHRGGRNGRMYSPSGPGSFYEGDMSSEELEERKALEDAMVMYEVDQATFPSLSQQNYMQPGGTANPAQFWSKLKKDGRRSVSPQQPRLDSPSPSHLSEKRGSDPMENIIPGQFQEMVLCNQEQGAGDATLLERHYSPVSPIMADEGVFQPVIPGPCDRQSSPQMSKSATPSSLSVSPALDAQSSSPPAIVPPGYVPPVAMGLPFYPFFIPMTDWNINGQVNLHATASKDPSGNDLPMSDISTLKFFYNLGTEYYRRLCMLQHLQHQQQCYQLQATGPLPPHQQQQQQQQQGTGAGFAHMMPHHPAMGQAMGHPVGIPTPQMTKNPYDVGGMTVVASGSGGQDEDDQQEGQGNFTGSNSARSGHSQNYMTEHINATPSPVSSAVYSEPFVPVGFQTSGVPPGQVPTSQLGIPTPHHNPYVYSHPVPTPMGYTAGKIQPVVPVTYSQSSQVAYLPMSSPGMSQQQQQQSYMAPPNGQGQGGVSSGGQYIVHTPSGVGSSSCSSQDSGIHSTSPPQATYTTSG